MAAGKSVVGTDTGGCREVVRDGVTGILVPPGDPAGLAGAMLRLVQDNHEADQMGKAGRKRVEAEFSMFQMIRRFSLLYEDLTMGKPGCSTAIE
jgi:glycosyltransferase involved in cell wall biosynthesis